VSPPLEIALARPDEHSAILALHREAGWPGTHVDGEVWAVRASGRIIGSAQLIELAPALILVDAVVVAADARGRGIGAELVRALLAPRAAEWWLECRAERIAFYERLGFKLAADPHPAVTERVRANTARQQHFLRLSTLTP
jgi:N-acetylglutamate synthase-like GNAT family acetyltransferase